MRDIHQALCCHSSRRRIKLITLSLFTFLCFRSLDLSLLIRYQSTPLSFYEYFLLLLLSLLFDHSFIVYLALSCTLWFTMSTISTSLQSMFAYWICTISMYRIIFIWFVRLHFFLQLFYTFIAKKAKRKKEKKTKSSKDPYRIQPLTLVCFGKSKIHWEREVKMCINCYNVVDSIFIDRKLFNVYYNRVSILRSHYGNFSNHFLHLSLICVVLLRPIPSRPFLPFFREIFQLNRFNCFSSLVSLFRQRSIIKIGFE